MKLNFLFFLIFLSFSSHAQHTFSSFTTAGIVAGENTPALEIQSVNGVRYGRFFLGVGIGKDDYFYKSLPLFVDGRIFISRNQVVFAYGDLGHNFALKNEAKEDYYDVNDFSGGVYTGFGLGMSTGFIGDSRLIFALGHTLKVMRLYQGYAADCIGCGGRENDNKFTFNRAVLKAGIAF